MVWVEAIHDVLVLATGSGEGTGGSRASGGSLGVQKIAERSLPFRRGGRRVVGHNVITRIFKLSFLAFSCLPDPHLHYLILFLITLFISTFQKDTNAFSFRGQLWIVLRIAG